MFNADDARQNVATYVENQHAEREADAKAWVEGTALELIKKESANGDTSCRVPCDAFCGERLVMAERMLTRLGFSVSYNSKHNHLYVAW